MPSKKIVFILISGLMILSCAEGKERLANQYRRYDNASQFNALGILMSHISRSAIFGKVGASILWSTGDNCINNNYIDTFIFFQYLDIEKNRNFVNIENFDNLYIYRNKIEKKICKSNFDSRFISESGWVSLIENDFFYPSCEIFYKNLQKLASSEYEKSLNKKIYFYGLGTSIAKDLGIKLRETEFSDDIKFMIQNKKVKCEDKKGFIKTEFQLKR